MELLVVVAVIGLLIGLLFPAFRSVRQSGDLARELSLARQLMVAYRAYAYDHRGVLMPGYLNHDEAADIDEPLPAFDDSGNRLVGLAAARYPWRIAPYLDYNLDGLYLDKYVKERLASDQLTDPEYLLSLYPSMGINGVFMGGDSQHDGFLPDNPAIPESLRKLPARRMGQVKHVTRLIVFVSARVNGTFAIPGTKLTEGFHKVTPPNMRDDALSWTTTYVPDCVAPGCDVASFGRVSLRHPGRTAAIGFFDGHSGTLTYAYDPSAPDGNPGQEDNIRDMRHWADQADGFDWTPQ